MPRFIRSFALFDNRDFLPRPFQIELYESCKSRDTIVFLRPGQGKYFITVMLVKYFIPNKTANQESVSKQKIFFLSKSLNSLKLYAAVFNAHTDLRIDEYYKKEINESIEREDWKIRSKSYEMHLMLAETFEKLLDQNLLDLNDINLLILDEVHKILLTKNIADCYTMIIRKLKQKHAECLIPKSYRILGLSASILLENVPSKVFEKMIEQIESELDCFCETYADLRMINKYSIGCRIKLRTYPPLNPSNEMRNNATFKLAIFLIRNHAAQFFSFIENFSVGSMHEQIINKRSISQILIDFLKVFGTMGEWCALKLIQLVSKELFETIILISKTKSNYQRMLNTALSTLQLLKQSILSYLDSDLRAALENDLKLSWQQFFSVSSPKLKLLVEILVHYLNNSDSDSFTPHTINPSSICSLIYAENSSSVRVLDEWLKELAKIDKNESNQIKILDYLMPDHVFLDTDDDDGNIERKNFNYRKHQRSLHEIYYHRRQEETLKKFRMAHNCNVLVTNSMSAEGLDVNRCNLVICFDPPQTFHQFILSKGRVRVEKGQFYVLVERNDQSQIYVEKFNEFCNIEKIFTKLVPLNNQIDIQVDNNISIFDTSLAQKQPKHLQSNLEKNLISPIEATDSKIKKEKNFSTLFSLTLDNAILFLNRYCNKLPSDTFTKLVPNYKIEVLNNPDESDSKPKYRCHLFLPINSTYRDEIIGEIMPNQSLAKQAAAFKAVKTLKEIGELDQNYYPIGKETSRYIEKLGLQECFVHSKISQHSLNKNSQPQHPKGNRFNRIQNRNIASKRRQYYKKKVSSHLCGQIFQFDSLKNQFYIQYLYEISMKLTLRISNDQNIRGRKIIDPADSARSFGVIVPQNLPQICDFTIFTRSGQVTVSLKSLLDADLGQRIYLDRSQQSSIVNFHCFTFENVLPLGKSSLKFDLDNSSNGNYLIVPINNDGTSTIDWNFIETIQKHSKESESMIETDQIEVKNFIFDEKIYEDAVVIPKYRKDKLQNFYYVAEICKDLTPLSPFPDEEYTSFEEYYRLKYSKTISNLEQPLLDVDHTSARLNFLTPKFLGRKCSVSKTSSNYYSKRNSQQKQILVPELCFIHPFPASLWRKAVALPCILYRLNMLLVAEEFRFKVAKEANIGLPNLPAGETWPKLDFGLSSYATPESLNVTSDSKIDPRSDDEISPVESSTVKLSNETKISDLFSSMDDWTSFASTIPNTYKCDDDDLFESENDVKETIQPHIEIISGPSGSSVIHYLSNEEVHSSGSDTEIQEINDASIHSENHAVRAGSPTYWKNQAEIKKNNAIPDNFDWTVWQGDSNTLTGTGFSLNIEDLTKEIADYVSKQSNLTSTDFGLKEDFDEEFEDESNSPFSDLEDDDNKSSYSDFDLDDSTEEEDETDESDENSDEDSNEYFEWNDQSESQSRPAQNRIKNLSQTMNFHQIRSVIYDLLKIELLYDPDYLKFSNFKNNHRNKFAIEQEPEYFKKRRLFDEMYREERQEVMDCIFRISSKMALHSNIEEEPFDQSPQQIQFDNNLDEINLNEPLKNVLMKKINMNLLENLEWEIILSNQIHSDPIDRFEDEIVYENHENRKNMEVKFGELLPNRDIDMVSHQVQADSTVLKSIRALSTSPQWLETDCELNSKLGPHPSLVLQAITMSNSSDGINLERLETVGDSFLKYSITAFLFCMCPELNEGKLSYLRSRQISNINLHRLGQKINLGEMMIASKFEPIDNWCPPSYQVVENSDYSIDSKTAKVPYNLLTQHSIPNKSIADCVEALIGTYLISCGSLGAIYFMDWLGLKVLSKEIKNNVKQNEHSLENNIVSMPNGEKWLPQPKSPLIIPKYWINDKIRIKEMNEKLLETYYKHRLDHFEKIIGYKFKDRAYIVQAFTHNSFYENTVTDCYQRLEFLGDAVLDYLITRYLYEDPRCHSPGTLTDLRSALVNNTFFAALAVKYNFHKYLMMLSSELYRVIDGFVRKFNIYYNHSEIFAQKTKENHYERGDKYECNYWELFISENEAEHLEDIEVPKALGDIFESVAGAIYLDSGMSLEAVWKAYYPMMRPEMENFSKKVPKSPIRVLLEKQPQSVKFGKPEITSGRRIRVTVEVFGVGKFVGIGRNKRIAKCTAAKRALRALENDNYRREMREKLAII